jgi:hypothetical protein
MSRDYLVISRLPPEACSNLQIASRLPLERVDYTRVVISLCSFFTLFFLLPSAKVRASTRTCSTSLWQRTRFATQFATHSGRKMQRAIALEKNKGADTRRALKWRRNARRICLRRRRTSLTPLTNLPISSGRGSFFELTDSSAGLYHSSASTTPFHFCCIIYVCICNICM